MLVAGAISLTTKIAGGARKIRIESSRTVFRPGGATQLLVDSQCSWTTLGVGRSGSRPSGEKELQQPDGIGNVDRAFSISVMSLLSSVMVARISSLNCRNGLTSHEISKNLEIFSDIV